MLNGDVPAVLADKKIVALDLSAMIAGAGCRGKFVEHFKADVKKSREATAKSSC